MPHMLAPRPESLLQLFERPLWRSKKLFFSSSELIVESIWMAGSAEILVQHVTISDQILFNNGWVSQRA
jgi:hypothetical protein